MNETDIKQDIRQWVVRNDFIGSCFRADAVNRKALYLYASVSGEQGLSEQELNGGADHA